MSIDINHLKSIIEGLKLNYQEHDENTLVAQLSEMRDYKDSDGDDIALIVFRLSEEGDLLQMHCPQAFTVSTDKLNSIASYCLRVQRDSWFVRWVLDRSDGELSPQVHIPIEDGQLAPGQIVLAISALLEALNSHYEEITKICNGSTEEVKKAASSEETESQVINEDIDKPEDSDNDPIQNFRQYLSGQIKDLQLPKGRPYGHVKIDQNFHVEFYVRKNHVSVGFYSIGTVDPENVINWIEKQNLRGTVFYKDQTLEPLHGKRNASVIRIDFSIPFDNKEDLANSDLRVEAVALFQKIQNTFSGIIDNIPEQFSNSHESHSGTCDTGPQTQGRKGMSETGTSFAISFDIISPTCIEDLESGTIAEEGEDLESAAIKVLDGVSDPVSTFRASLSVEFDGDLDEPDRFNSIRLTGYTGPDRNSPESCSFGKFTLFGIAEISDDYAEEEEEEILEDILHAIVINMSTNKYSVDFGEWEEYSISVEGCPPNAIPLTAEWVPEE